MEYDNFKPLYSLGIKPTEFVASHYETWIEGQMVDGEECQVTIKFLPSRKSNGQPTYAVSLAWNKGKAKISNNFMLDVGFSQNDRLTYATIPQETSQDAVGIIAMRNIVGITEPNMRISGNIPYCGNMFMKYGVLVKMSFAFSQPEKLIEFYSGEAQNQIYSLITAKCALELLIEDHDSDGAYVGFEAIKDYVLEKFSIEVKDHHLKLAEEMLNSGAGGYANVVSTGFTNRFERYFKSNYGKGPLRSTLEVVNNDLS